MLLCDRCDRGWHGKCLMPAINSVPKGKCSMFINLLLIPAEF